MVLDHDNYVLIIWKENIEDSFLNIAEEPRISLPETFGACAKAPTEVKVTMKEKNFRDPNTWKVNWYHWHRWYGGWKRSPTAQGSTTLRVPKPLLRQTGEWYEVEVRNQFGFAKGVSKIIVIEGKLSFVLWYALRIYLTELKNQSMLKGRQFDFWVGFLVCGISFQWKTPNWCASFVLWLSLGYPSFSFSSRTMDQWR